MFLRRNSATGTRVPAYGAMLVLLLLSPLALGQPQEPSFRIEIVAGSEPSSSGRTPVAFQISVTPPYLYAGGAGDADRAGDTPVAATMTLEADLYSGRWLRVVPDSGGSAANTAADTAASDEEAFVLAKFHAFREFAGADQFRDLLDAETHAGLLDSVARGEIDLVADREFYRQFDNIRLLAGIHYGVYILLYTQFRDAVSGEVFNSVMPARYVDGRLVTAGSLHRQPSVVYRMLAFGALQRQLMDHLEARLGQR